MFVLQGSRAPRPYDEQYWFHRTGHGSQICGGEEGATESGMMVLEGRTGRRNWGWAGGGCEGQHRISQSKFLISQTGFPLGFL